MGHSLLELIVSRLSIDWLMRRTVVGVTINRDDPNRHPVAIRRPPVQIRETGPFFLFLNGRSGADTQTQNNCFLHSGNIFEAGANSKKPRPRTEL